MEEKLKSLSERLLDYGVDIVKVTVALNKNTIGRTMANQLLRAGTSAGANYEESGGARSRRDFIYKLQIVLKELRESRYWLRLVRRSNIIKNYNFDNIITETEQLCNIIAKSIITAKNNPNF